MQVRALMSSVLYKWFAKNLVVGAALALGVVVGIAASFAKHSNDGRRLEEASELIGSLPSPDLSPEDVVKIQMEALQRAAHSPQAFADCYAFASLANRRVFGRLEQFKSMLERSYSSLIGHRSVLIGRARIEGDFAYVLVTGIDSENGGMSFEFLLSKQQQSPFQNCWMTDTVFEVAPVGAPFEFPSHSASIESVRHLNGVQ